MKTLIMSLMSFFTLAGVSSAHAHSCKAAVISYAKAYGRTTVAEAVEGELKVLSSREHSIDLKSFGFRATIPNPSGNVLKFTIYDFRSEQLITLNDVTAPFPTGSIVSSTMVWADNGLTRLILECSAE